MIQYICNLPDSTHSTWFTRARADEECSQIFPKSIQVPFLWRPARSLRGHPKSAAIGQGPFCTRHVVQRNCRSITGVTAWWDELSAAAGADRWHGFWCCFAAGAWCTSFQGQPARSKHDLLWSLSVCLWCSSHTHNTTPSDFADLIFYFSLCRCESDIEHWGCFAVGAWWKSLQGQPARGEYDLFWGLSVWRSSLSLTHTHYITPTKLWWSHLFLFFCRYESHWTQKHTHKSGLCALLTQICKRVTSLASVSHLLQPNKYYQLAPFTYMSDWGVNTNLLLQTWTYTRSWYMCCQ